MTNEIATAKMVLFSSFCISRSPVRSARTINAGEPVKKPKTHRCGEVEDHLTEFGLEFRMKSFHGSPLPMRKHHLWQVSVTFLTGTGLYVTESCGVDGKGQK
jgi:hypothetical protein